METETTYIIHALMLMCALFCKVEATITYADVKSDYETLLSAYQVSHSGDLHDVIPKNLTSGPLVVHLGLSLHGMLGFDMVDGYLKLGGSLNVVWEDEIMEMAGVTFKQTQSPIVVTNEQIWTPDLVVVNGQDFDGKLGDTEDVIRYNTSTGECNWDITLIMKVACTSHMLYFPYDEHKCALTVRSWLHGSSDVQLGHAEEQWNIDYLEPNALWDVTGTSTELVKEKTHDAIFKITIKRKPHFIATVMLIPILIISFLSLFSFIIPPFSQERICFSIMCFVSFVVLLDCLTNFIPRAVFPGSLVCAYLLIMVILNVSVCIVNVVMMRIHLGKYTGKVPKPLQKFINFLTLRPCKSVSKVQDIPPHLERQDTVFNIRFPTKNIGEDLNGETIEEEDSVFELSDDNCGTTKKTDEYGRQTVNREVSSDQITELEKENVGIIKIEQAVDSSVVENCTNITRDRGAGNAQENQTNDSDKDSISSLETTYTIRSIAIKPTLVEENYTLSFNTYLPRGLQSSKMKTSIRHDVIPKRSRSRIGSKGQKRKPDTDITPVEHAPPVFQTISKPSNEVNSTTDEADQTNTESCTNGELNDRKDSGVSDNYSKLGASVSDRSDGAYMSASDHKTDSDDGRTASTRISSSTFTTSLSSATPKVNNEMTWSYVGHVLDLFFMVLFAVVHIIFTVAFMVPMSTGH